MPKVLYKTVLTTAAEIKKRMELKKYEPPRTNAKIKAKLIKRLWVNEHKVAGRTKRSEQRKMIEAFADHLSGETIKDAALKYGLRVETLQAFKVKYLRTDSALPQYLEELFYHLGIKAVGIVHDKIETLSAHQAIITAGIATEKAIQLAKARKTDYADDSIPLSLLQRIASLQERRNQPKIIDVQPEVKRIEEKSINTNPTNKD